MADNYLEISHQVPLNFVDINRELPTAYNFKHFDAWKSHEQRLSFQQGPCYFQKWQQGDIIFMQVKANYDPIRLRMIDVNTGIEQYQQLMDVTPTSDADTSAIYLESQMSLSPLADGFYKVRLEAGSPVQVTLESETFYVKQEHERTLLLRIRNDFNNNIMYETGIFFLFRVDGVVAEYTPGSTRTSWIDQPGNAATVKGEPFRTFKLFIGCDGGVPDWVIDKLEEYLDQTELLIDGKGFAANPGAKFSVNRLERYAWAQWSIDIRETNNSRVKRFESDGLNERKVAIDYNVSLRGFGPVEGEANDNTAALIEVT